MKKIKFVYKISIVLNISRHDAKVIFDCLSRHPDTKKYARPGGFAYSFLNFFADEPSFDFEFTQLSLMIEPKNK